MQTSPSPPTANPLRLAWSQAAAVNIKLRGDIPAPFSGLQTGWVLLQDALFIDGVCPQLVRFEAIGRIQFIGQQLRGESAVSELDLADFLARAELPIRVEIMRMDSTRLEGWLVDCRPGLLMIGLAANSDVIALPIATVAVLQLHPVENSFGRSVTSDWVGEESSD